MNTWGKIFKVSIFGESHGPAIGAVIDGLPPGLAIDEDYIAKEMARRAPGRDKFSTARKEGDEPRIVSGVKGGVSTGAPIACIIENTNQRSGDYDTPLRPGHADWTGLIKYSTALDRAGGGRFSGRLTAPLVFAGAVAKLVLSGMGIEVFAHIKSIAGVESGMDLIQDELRRVSAKAFPASDEAEQGFKDMIIAAKRDGDSVGGTIEVAAFGVPGGIGEPFFESVESTLSSLYFSVPAVKGVEFGKGFAIADLRGSEANDPLMLAGGRIISAKNDNGGVLGGISNGMPIVARVAVKPTSSIAKPQRTVDPHDGGAEGAHLTETEFTVRGRHDPCIVPRAVPVIEAVTAIGLLDLIYRK
ncbi:MAG: chorismate synthase [Clostridiales Family XIII bacterium]|nr:chorismate synthase [Clostridiales Family XIII bacterium]